VESAVAGDGAQPSQPAATPLNLSLLYSNLRSAKRGVSGGLAGTKAEHLKPLLETQQSMDALGAAATKIAHGNIPPRIAEAMAMGQMTALEKPNAARRDVRGIACGDLFRRLVGRTLAQQHGPAINRACAPYQFALNTRAGTDAAAHFLRAATDLRQDATIIALDGIGAYDHVLRAEIFRGLLEDPELSPLLPYARTFYGRSSKYVWYGDDGRAHLVEQGEGVEQGDALSQAFFSIALHRALRELRADSNRGRC